jgi:hypothetical protein
MFELLTHLNAVVTNELVIGIGVEFDRQSIEFNAIAKRRSAAF